MQETCNARDQNWEFWLVSCVTLLVLTTPKIHEIECMRNGRSGSSKVVDFSAYGTSLHCFWDTASYWPKNASIPYPTLISRPRWEWTLSDFWMSLILEPISRWRFCDPSLLRFDTMPAHVRRTDRQTDIPTMASTGLCIASCAEAL